MEKKPRTPASASSASNSLHEKTSMFTYFLSGNVWTLMWLSAMMTNPETPQSSGTGPW